MDAAKSRMVTVEWLRLVQSLFQDMLGLTLQFYILVLVRRRDIVRFASIVCACFSMAINVALMWGEKQPGVTQWPNRNRRSPELT
jgi:hypothetical protein